MLFFVRVRFDAFTYLLNYVTEVWNRSRNRVDSRVQKCWKGCKRSSRSLS